MAAPETDPTLRFSGLADLYASYRPTYPSEAVNYIVDRANLNTDAVVADIGCGTGISSRLFAELGFSLLGIEPNEDMRQEAARTNTLANVQYFYGTAENTTLSPESVDLVLAAQSFHWFEPDRAFAEFHRILKESGWLALMWNERDESDRFTCEYGQIIRSVPGATQLERSRALAGKPLLTSTLFRNAEEKFFSNRQILDEPGLIGRAMSASYVPKEGPLAEQLISQLRTLFRTYQQDGTVSLQYRTSVYTAHKTAHSGSGCGGI